MRDDPLFWIVALAVLGVAGILLFGVGTFGRGGEFNRRNANRIMRWRIGAQAVAVALILFYIWFRNGGTG